MVLGLFFEGFSVCVIVSGGGLGGEAPQKNFAILKGFLYGFCHVVSLKILRL